MKPFLRLVQNAIQLSKNKMFKPPRSGLVQLNYILKKNLAVLLIRLGKSEQRSTIVE